MKHLMRRLKRRKLGMAALMLQLITSVVLAVFVFKLHILNYGYAALLGGILAILFVLMVIGNGSRKKVHYLARMTSVFLSVLFVLGAYYCTVTKETLDKMTHNNVQMEYISVYVLKENKATKLTDIADGKFAVLKTMNSDKVQQTVDTISTSVRKGISTKEYKDATAATKALYSKEVEAVIMDESFVELVKDHDTYKNFDEKTKKIETYEFKTALENENRVSKITQEPFNVFVSGIDAFGDPNRNGRSDVNLIVTVNPKTKQILFTSTPRDYYVYTKVSGDMKDKLTHAGNAGIKCSIGTIEDIYNIKINYYVRTNFSGFKKIIDALGGISVHSDYDFVSAQGPAFVKGKNQMNGKQALAFVRERYAFPNGDFQRIKDQQYVMKGVMDKVISPAILTNFSALMKSIEGNMNTNLKQEEITSFIKMQLTENPDWDVKMISVSGLKGIKGYTYSEQSKRLWVLPPNQQSVQNATGLINEVLEGNVFTQEEAKEAMKNGIDN